MNLPSRKERKALAKAFGLVKKKESFKERMERITRSQEIGKQIHLQHLQNMENQRREEEKAKEKEQTSWEQQELKKTISESNPEE
jgi:hypothetical protein